MSLNVVTPGPAPQKQGLKEALRKFISERFDLHEDAAYEGQTLESVRRGIVFKGANLWILMFAILICSIGLNVNSTAVIIGAMLISPLMGPILGIGCGVAIFDFDLLLQSAKNMAIATVAAIAVSALYFLLSPIEGAQSELLARTAPTLFDVLIATFGGFAGIIAVSRREKTNAIPGVAIATALMPPVCTAGYGLANGELWFFVGALYLYFINLVFIAFSTFLLVRFMRFTRTSFVDEAQEKRVKRWTYAITLLVAIPSVYTAYTTVQDSVYQYRVNRFIEQEADFRNAQVIGREVRGYTHPDGPQIKLMLLGEKVSEADVALRQERLRNYHLEGVELVVLQDRDEIAVPMESTQSGDPMIFERLWRAANEELGQRNQDLEKLRGQMRELNIEPQEQAIIIKEAKALFPQLNSIRFGLLPATPSDTTRVGIAVLELNGSLKAQDQLRLGRWLAARRGLDSVRVIP